MDGYSYLASHANADSIKTLSECRKGSSITLEEYYYLGKTISKGLEKGMPLVHIYKSDIKLRRICSLRYLYTLIEKELIPDVKAIDLRRKVSYKSRKKSLPILIRSNKIGRSYTDFAMEKEKLDFYVQMDTVVGKRSKGKILLTFLVTGANFMFARLLEDKSSTQVVKAFNDIQNLIGLEEFKKLFRYILTDNGSEFTLIDQLETVVETGEIRSKIYFCDPRQSQQKGSIEKNHEYIRYFISSGNSFDQLTQEKVDLMMSHINSTYRISSDYTPFDLVTKFIDESTIIKLGIRRIQPNDIVLTPNLIK